jgi:transposase
MTGECIENWVENNPLKCIGSGKTVIMDNARFHRKKQLEEICGKAGIGLLFLPPYSPDFNPVEKEWANMKRELRDTASLHALFETAIYKYWS